jgi:hypothetical protein
LGFIVAFVNGIYPTLIYKLLEEKPNSNYIEWTLKIYDIMWICDAVLCGKTFQKKEKKSSK